MELAQVGGRLLRTPQLLARFLMLTDDHALHVLVERFLATAEDDDIYGLTPPRGGEAVARAYVIAVEAVGLDELSEHLLNESGLGRRPQRFTGEYVDQRFRAAWLIAVDVDGLSQGLRHSYYGLRVVSSIEAIAGRPLAVTPFRCAGLLGRSGTLISSSSSLRRRLRTRSKLRASPCALVHVVGRNRLGYLGSVEVSAPDFGADQESLRLRPEQQHHRIRQPSLVQQVQML